MAKLTSAFLFMLCSLSALAAPFTADDMVRMERLSAPALSPNEAQLVYVVRQTDMDADRGRTNLWLTGLAGQAIQLTSHPASDHSPQWSNDGKWVYFLSSRAESSQLWRIGATGGEAQQVSDYPLDVSSFKLSPDNRLVALSFQVYPDCQALDCTVDRDAANAKEKATGQVYDKLFVRHWDRWLDKKLSRLFVASLADGTSGAARLVSGDVHGNIPSSPFGGSEEYNFSADGQQLYFSARIADASEAWSTDFDIYRVAIEGGPASNLTDDNPALDTQPVLSADGKYLAYLAMARAGFEADRLRVMLLDLSDGSRKSISDDWDRSFGSLAFAPDNRTLIVNGSNLGNRSLWALDSKSGSHRVLVEKGFVGSYALGKKNIVYGKDTLASPVQFFVTDYQGKKHRQLTQHNAAELEKIDFGEFEQFSFPGWNNETVYGYVVKPSNYQRGKKYPVAFLIHGGPQGSFGNHFHYRWNPQTYAGQGIAAVFIDFHGSTGYGQEFTDSISEDWGGKPLEDLQKGLAAAIDRYDFLDEERVCALGASYGGFMISWIAGKWPDRFKCLVNHDGVFDNRMMYYATEELWFTEWENGGPQFDHAANYETFNPVNFVKNWKTPTLVIQGELDYRVPVTQALGVFTALQRQGIESRFLYFPDENHWVLKPHNSLQWHREVNAWLHRFLH